MYYEYEVKVSKIVSGRKRYPAVHLGKGARPKSGIKKVARRLGILGDKNYVFEVLSRSDDISKAAKAKTNSVN